MDRLSKVLRSFEGSSGDGQPKSPPTPSGPNLETITNIQTHLEKWKKYLEEDPEDPMHDFCADIVNGMEAKLAKQIAKGKRSFLSDPKAVKKALKMLEIDVIAQVDSYEKCSSKTRQEREDAKRKEERRRAQWIASSDAWTQIRPPADVMLHPEVIQHFNTDPSVGPSGSQRQPTARINRVAHHRRLLALAGDRTKQWAIEADLTPFDPKSTEYTWTVGKRRVGEGAVGVVYPVTVYKKDPEDDTKDIPVRMLAVKQMPVSGDRAVDKHRLSKQCTAFLKSIKYPHIVNTVGFDPSVFIPSRNEEQFWIFMEFVGGGVLSNVLNDAGGMRESVALPTIIQIARGLAHLHSIDIVHRDMKAANVLLSDAGCAKIADLDSAKDATSALWQEPPNSSFGGTEFWLSPEAARGEFSARSDVWSFGCVVLEILTRKRPWEMYGPTEPGSIRLKLVEMVDREEEMEGPPIPSDKLSPAAQKALKRIFVPLPYRIGIAGLLEDPWLKGDD